jgi:Protein of unknown function (DUF3048) N-terminal domain/Protein of unknown function (DUF3048) C-terminal domain
VSSPTLVRCRRALGAASLAVLAACGGASAAVTSGTASDPSSAAVPTASIAQLPDEVTTDAPAPASTEAATTTTEPGPPVYPLTGTLVTDGMIAARPALVVKIDNAPGARPQSGMNEADIVIEELVNDNLTRFAFVFHSQGADPVGPIRSGRMQDIDLFGAFNGPLFAWSGGNRTVTDAIRASDLIDIGPNRVPAYFRSDRNVPHNLYSTTNNLWVHATPGAPAPQQQFQYRRDGDEVQGAPSPGVALVMDAIDLRWDWDPAAGLYRRTMERKVHEDTLSGPVTTNNVIVLAMEYVSGISDSPDAQTIGTGEAFVFTGGNYIHGTWSRADRLSPFTLTADDGSVINLTPGRTFIELPRLNSTIPLPAA